MAATDPQTTPVAVPRSVVASLSALLLLFTAAAWWVYLRPPVIEVDPEQIQAIPLVFGSWRGEEEPLTEDVREMLNADAQTLRLYRGEDADLVWLYVGYYGTARGGRPEHTPWGCYPATGWRIVSSSERPMARSVAAEGGAALMELVVEQSGERRLVHFWYATHRSQAIATSAGLTVDHVISRLTTEGRADGALVRLSTPIEDESIETARDRLERFAGPLMEELGRHWPSAR